jgi:hypothetical protein
MLVFLNDEENHTVKNITNFWKLKPVNISQLGRWFVRISALVVLISLSWTLNGNSSWYTKKVEGFAKWYAFNFDTETYSHCKLSKGQRITYIDSEKVILASVNEGVYEFVVSKCINIQ